MRQGGFRLDALMSDRELLLVTALTPARVELIQIHIEERILADV